MPVGGILSRIGRKTTLLEVNCNAILAEVLADLGTVIQEKMATIESPELPIVKGYGADDDAATNFFNKKIIEQSGFAEKIYVARGGQHALNYS